MGNELSSSLSDKLSPAEELENLKVIYGEPEPINCIKY